jgi:hypothetical protein
MEDRLNKDSIMECPRHGLQRPTFVCKHLQSGEGLGFNRPDGAPDPGIGRLRMPGVINVTRFSMKKENGTKGSKNLLVSLLSVKVVLKK